MVYMPVKLCQSLHLLHLISRVKLLAVADASRLFRETLVAAWASAAHEPSPSALAIAAA